MPASGSCTGNQRESVEGIRCGVKSGMSTASIATTSPIDTYASTAGTPIFPPYPVRLLAEGRDKPGLLAAVSGVIAEAGVNIAGARVTTDGGRAITEFELEIKNLEQLRKLIDQVRRLKGVTRVERLRGGAGGPPA